MNDTIVFLILMIIVVIATHDVVTGGSLIKEIIKKIEELKKIRNIRE